MAKKQTRKQTRNQASKQSGTLGKFKLTARTDAPDFRDFPYRPALITQAPARSA